MPTLYSGIARLTSSTPLLADSPQLIATNSSRAGSSSQVRSYQPRPPRPSNASTKVSRYSVSGTTHRNGTLAMFCVMWLVDASSISEPSAASTSQSP
jgi:hypothetical protein